MVGKSTRQKRNVRHRSQSLSSPRMPLKAPNRRVPKRRKLRDSDSQNLEGCYYACEDQGYHVDPDVHVGREAVPNGNKYWLLDADITDPTANIDEPPPFPEPPQPIAAASTSTLPHPDTKRGTVPSKIMPHDNPQVDLLTGSGYDIGVPSPFLYHGTYHGFTPPSNTVQPGWGIPYFEYRCGQAQPEPDFVSYRSLPAAPRGRPALTERRESLGLALCAPASSKHRAEASCISDDSHDTSTHGCPLPPLLGRSECEETQVTVHCGPSNTDSIIDWQRNTPLEAERSCDGDFVARRRFYHVVDQPLVFPTTVDDLVNPESPSAGDFVARRRFYHTSDWSYMSSGTSDNPIDAELPPAGDFVAHRRFYHVADRPYTSPNTGGNLTDPEPSSTSDFVARRRFYHVVDRPYIFPTIDDNLIYPTLPSPRYAPGVITAKCSINNIVQAWSDESITYWEDSAQHVRALTGPDDHIMVAPPIMIQIFPSPNSYTTEILENVYDQGDSDPISANGHIGTATQDSLSACIDVVPARLHQHQYIAWPAAMPAATPTSGGAVSMSFEDPCNDSENVHKLFNWLDELNLLGLKPEDSQNVSGSFSDQPTGDRGYQCCEDVPISESEHGTRQCASRPGALQADNDTMQCSRYDEGYVTASDHYSEAEVLSESQTDDGWAYWDWESETENEDRPDREPESTTPRQEVKQVESGPDTLWGILV